MVTPAAAPAARAVPAPAAYSAGSPRQLPHGLVPPSFGSPAPPPAASPRLTPPELRRVVGASLASASGYSPNSPALTPPPVWSPAAAIAPQHTALRTVRLEATPLRWDADSSAAAGTPLAGQTLRNAAAAPLSLATRLEQERPSHISTLGAATALVAEQKMVDGVKWLSWAMDDRDPATMADTPRDSPAEASHHPRPQWPPPAEGGSNGIGSRFHAQQPSQTPPPAWTPGAHPAWGGDTGRTARGALHTAPRTGAPPPTPLHWDADSSIGSVVADGSRAGTLGGVLASARRRTTAASSARDVDASVPTSARSSPARVSPSRERSRVYSRNRMRDSHSRSRAVEEATAEREDLHALNPKNVGLLLRKTGRLINQSVALDDHIGALRDRVATFATQTRHDPGAVADNGAASQGDCG